MSVSEQDLELLESLLDGELPAGEEDSLRQRLSGNPELAQAFDRIRAERELRQQIWQALEPRESDVATLVSGVRAAIRRDEIWTRRARSLRYVSGLAACITVGFLVGRFVPYGPMNSPDRGSGIVFEPAPGAMAEVSYDPTPGRYKVLLTDANGRVIAEQPFNTLSEAREFTDDLKRLQSPQQMRPMRVSDTIFTKDQF